MTTTKFASDSPCPQCGARHDAAISTIEDATPSPGDATVCLRCGAILIFDDALVPREPTVRESLDLQTSALWPVLSRLQRIAIQMAAVRRGTS